MTNPCSLVCYVGGPSDPRPLVAFLHQTFWVSAVGWWVLIPIALAMGFVVALIAEVSAAVAKPGQRKLSRALRTRAFWLNLAISSAFFYASVPAAGAVLAGSLRV